MGHLVRGANIAKAVLELEPDADILFYTRSLPPDEMRDARFSYVCESDPRGVSQSQWFQAIESFHPHVVVYDTVLPKQSDAEPPEPPDTPRARPDTPKRVYVMRRCKLAQHQAVLDHPFLKNIDWVLIPHNESEFGYDLPFALAQKAAFVGPIVRTPSADARLSMRSKYGVAHDAFLITSTPGGGGFGPDTDAFFDVVFRAHHELKAKVPHMHHVVIQGPRYDKSLSALSQMTVVSVESGLVDLIAASDVVIAAGGYNTVNEVRVCKTPAIFLPGARTHDDQTERVDRLAQRGLGWVLSDRSSTDLAVRIAELCASPTALTQAREHYNLDHFDTGNQTSAQHILSLVKV